MQNAIEQNGIMIARTPNGLGVGWGTSFFPPTPNKILTIEIEYNGKPLKNEVVQTYGQPWRDYFGSGIDHLRCAIRVKDGNTTLAELATPESILPFMVLQVPQTHITENYVSVPPALHITDSVGAVFTLDFTPAEKEQSPKGEFAFFVLRDGISTNEIASRIECRNGTVRIFTRSGWKQWLGSSF